jgi:hypothetical protein
MKKSHVRLHMLCVHKVVLRKTDFRLAYVKRQILMLTRRHFMVYFYLFYTNHMQCHFFAKLLRTHMDYEDVHVKFFV